MPVYGKKEGAEKEERTEEAIDTRSFKSFVGKEKTQQFISKWKKKGYTKAGVEELMFELYARYGGDGDDDDEDRVRERAGEMLDIMKSVRGLFEPFKKD
ncbi:hypothetical protein GF415_03015 [Candidatus Micrarchaeota archaeon]|nr:hypothetical protein [Candidatus Micrarchaeota archaeon]